jgi:hypothetical protein
MTYPEGHPETGVKVLFYNPSVYMEKGKDD